MKSIIHLSSRIVEKFYKTVCQELPIILSATVEKKILMIFIFLFHIYPEAHSQNPAVFLSRTNSCHVGTSKEIPSAFNALSVGSPIVRVAYVIPSNRTPQTEGVVNLQKAIKVGQQYYKDQMEQNGFGAKTYVFEMEADKLTPMIHVVHVSETDEFLRGDIWGRTIQAASSAGLTVWAPGELWVLIPEAHKMLPDGSVIGGVALGAGSGSGNSPGVAMIGSNALPLFDGAKITDNTPYNGKVLSGVGPFPMKQDVTFAWFEGNTFSSVASSMLGALFHEMGHAFGLAHDYRNDNNFHGNLMFNGLRGIRGSLFPEKYPQDYTRLEYTSALILNVSHYFNSNQSLTSSPIISYSNPGTVIPQQGLVHIAFQASDNDLLSFAHLRYRGDAVAELKLQGIAVNTAFAIPYYNQGDFNAYTLAVHDQQGNTTYRDVQFYVPTGHNQAPVPFIRIEPPVPGKNQPIVLNASLSTDIDNVQSSLLASWDVDNDGKFDTEPSTNKVVEHLYNNPGNYLVRLKLTDPGGAQTISTPLSVKIPGEKKITVESFTLVDADKDEDIRDLENGAVIEVSSIERKKLNVRANTSAGMITYVQFDLKGPVSYRQTEKLPPYALFGDNPVGNYHGKKLPPGEYTLTATPYSSREKGVLLSVSFKVIKVNPSNQPTIVWDKTIGGPWVDGFTNIVVSTPDKGYLLGGISNSNAGADKSENIRGADDFWVVKLDAQRNKIWDKTLGGADYEELESIVQTTDGGYLLGGSSVSDISGDKTASSKGSADYWVVKINSQGNKVWDKSFGGDGPDYLGSLVAIPGGGYLLAGHSSSDASGDKSANSKGMADYWLVRIDEQGNKIWDKTIGSAEYDVLTNATVTPDGFLLCGNSNSDISGDKSEDSRNSSQDYWIVKVNRAGAKQWDKTIGGNDFDRAESAILTRDGGYLVVGYSKSYASAEKSEDSKGDVDGWVVKVDARGKIEWDKTYGGDSYDPVIDVILTPGSGYLLTGSSMSNASGDKSENSKGNLDFWVVKIDNLGNKVWDKTIGGEGIDDDTRAILTKQGNYILAGSSSSNAFEDKSENSKGLIDYWLLELKESNIPEVKSVTLINAYSDQDVKEINDGEIILLTEIGTRFLSIRANVTNDKINRVDFELCGPVQHKRKDTTAPFSLFGDNKNDYIGKQLLAGAYSLKVTPYINNTAVPAHYISFVVKEGFAISGFTLIDATLNKEIGKLSDGDVIDLSLLKDHKLSVRANTEPKHIDKVDLRLHGPIVYAQTEQRFPYTLFGDLPKDNNNTNYVGMKFIPGTYNLTVFPYLNGIKGTPVTVTFEVTRGGHATCRKVEVFPLPATDVINISYEGMGDRVQLVLLDFNGNVVLNRTLSQLPVEQLDVSAFRKGIYYLKILSPEDVEIIRVAIE